MSGPTQITFALKTPTGEPVVGGKISFALSGFDLDEAIVIPTTIEATIAADGTGVVNLWPNIAGLRNTSYKLTVGMASGTKVEIGSIIVPASLVPVPMHTLISLVPLGGLVTLVMTQTEYDALETKNDQTIYLIRAED
ncbi:MAG TPA: hypothetical protein VGC40_12890 [Paenirhodobacter sp.]